MDKSTISALAFQVNVHLDNDNNSRAVVKRKINGILHNKKVTTIIADLSVYIETLSGQKRNQSVLFTIWALFIRDLDCLEELAHAVSDYNLIGNLYGGLHILLTGESKFLRLKIEWNDNRFSNKYEFLTRFNGEFHYWDCIEIMCMATLLYKTSPQKLEKLLFEDKSNLLLLNMCSHQLPIKAKDEVIKRLLNDDCELRQNIGLALGTSVVSDCLSDIKDIQRTEQMGFNPHKNLKEVEQKLDTAMAHFWMLFQACGDEIKCRLSLNYLLCHKKIYPVFFARYLVSSTSRPYLLWEIEHSDKLKSLSEISFIAGLVASTPALNEKGHRISKRKIFECLTQKILTCVVLREGIYSWDEQNRMDFKELYRNLTKPCRNVLRTELIKAKQNLLCSPLDELVRFKLYLADKRQQDIIEGMLGAIQQYMEING